MENSGNKCQTKMEDILKLLMINEHPIIEPSLNKNRRYIINET